MRTLHVDFREAVLDARVGALHDLVELQLREVPPDLVLPEELLALPKLRHLGMTGKDDRLVVPELVRRLRLDRLDVWDLDAADLPPLPQLRHLDIVVKDPKREVAILAERFHQLEHLEIWGSSLEHGELPDDIERFGKLATLVLVACGVRTLPEAFAKLRTLRTFGVRGCPMTELPDVLVRMPGLAALHVGVELTGLPAGLAAMTGLRELDLASALNHGAMVSSYDDTATLKPLPRVLGELTGLERLNLDCCGVVDASPLRSLANLRALSLAWAAIPDIEAVGALANLEELSIASCDRVRDLTPLATLTKLRVLNLDHTSPDSLDVLRVLPALKILHVESCDAKRIDPVFDLDVELHADDDIKERFAARAGVRALPAVDVLLERVGARDLATVETACDQLATWASASSTRDRNAFATLAVGGWIPALDLALDRHLARLSPAVLGALFAALFHTTGDELAAATRVAKELVSRGDAPGVDAGQLAVVAGFIKASELYDAGHRAHGTGVHDTLIDAVFPHLRGPALAALLAWCSNDHLDDGHGDGLFALMPRALDRATGADLERVLARLDALVDDAIASTARPGELAERVWAMRGPPAARAGIAAMRTRLEAKLAEAAARAALDKRLRDPDTAGGALAEVSVLPDDQLAKLQGALWGASEHATLDATARGQLLRLWERLDREDGIAAAIATFALTEVPDLDVLASTANRGTLLRLAILDALATEDYPGEALDALRTLATRYDQLPKLAADSEEVRALLYGSAKTFDRDRFTRAIALLASVDTYEKPAVPDDDDGELATMIAHLAESTSYELLQAFARQLAKLQLTGMPLERVLAQLVAVCMVAEDPEGLALVMALVPPQVSWDILAYNLACKYARDGDRVHALLYTKRALDLGKSPDQFLADSDFDELAGDAMFVALLDAHR
ncbi:MAG: hypothetical protein ABI867_33375 [Kofleriaceae bacterium]